MRKQKTSGVKKWIWRVLFLAALSVFVYSGYQLFHIYYQNYQEGEEKNEITEIAEIPKKADPEKEAFTINWKALKEINEQIIGWILIPDTDISYPIVQGTDNVFYLTHTYWRSENYAGAIFMDYLANRDYKDYNTFIYGHNVKHGTMFAELENFKDADFYNKHPYVYIFTPEKNYRTEVISMYSTIDSSESYTLNTTDKDSYEAYIKMVKELAEVKRDVKMEPTDRMLTLSTCSYEKDGEPSDARYLLHAKLVPWEGKYMVDKK